MEFPTINRSYVPKAGWSIPTEEYIGYYLECLMGEAAKKGFCTMIFRHVPNRPHVIQYGLSKTQDINIILAIYEEPNERNLDIKDTLIKHPELNIKDGYHETSGEWKTYKTSKAQSIPTHIDIAKKFVQFGYDILHRDGECFIVNWSKFMKTKPEEPIASSSQIEVSPSQTQITIDDFFYRLALIVLQKKSAIDIIFIINKDGGIVLVDDPPSEDLRNFITDINTIVERREIGYKINYAVDTDRDTLLIMTFPLSAAQKVISNLQI